MYRLLCILGLAVMIAACNGEQVRGSGNIVTESRDVGSFKRVQLSGSMDVFLQKADNHTVVVEGDDNILELVETYVDNGKLRIKYKDHFSVWTKRDVVVRVGLPELTEAVITGSGDIKGESLFSSGEEVKVQVTGSGDIELELDAPAVKAGVTGSGDIKLSGHTRDIDCSTTGSGTIKATDLKAENAKARTSGSGNISVYASQKVDAGVTGSGDIRYKGGATASSKITGSGSVRAID